MAWPEEYMNVDLDSVGLLIGDGKTKEAQTRCEELLNNLSPGPERDCIVLYSIECALKTGAYDKAEQMIQDLSTRHPEHARILSAQGYLYLLRNNIPKSHEYFERAKIQDPLLANTLAGLGFCYLNDEKWELAFQYLTQTLDQNPTHMEALVALVNTAFTLQREDETIPYLKRSLYEQPFNPYFRFHLACVYLAQEKITTALEELEKILAILPTYTEAKELQKKILAACGDNTES